jgi:hypothetical protein
MSDHGTGGKQRMAEAKRNDVTAKLDAGVARDAKLVAVYRGVPLAELLSELLRPTIKERLAAEQAKAAREGQGKPPKK